MVHCLWVKNSPFHNPSQYIASCPFFLQFFNVLSIVFKNGHLFSFVWLFVIDSRKSVCFVLLRTTVVIVSVEHHLATWSTFSPLVGVETLQHRWYILTVEGVQLEWMSPLTQQESKPSDPLNTYTHHISIFSFIYFAHFVMIQWFIS